MEKKKLRGISKCLSFLFPFFSSVLEAELGTWLILDKSSVSKLHLYPYSFCFLV